MMGEYVFVQEIVNTMADIFASPFKAVAEITLEYILQEGFSALIMYPIVIYLYCMLFRWITNLAKKEVAMIKGLFRKSIRKRRKKREEKFRRKQFQDKTELWHETDSEFEKLYQKYCG